MTYSFQRKWVSTANLRRATTSNSNPGSIIDAQWGYRPLILYYLIKYSIMGQNTVVVVSAAAAGVAVWCGGEGNSGEPWRRIAQACCCCCCSSCCCWCCCCYCWCHRCSSPNMHHHQFCTAQNSHSIDLWPSGTTNFNGLRPQINSSDISFIYCSLRPQQSVTISRLKS